MHIMVAYYVEADHAGIRRFSRKEQSMADTQDLPEQGLQAWIEMCNASLLQIISGPLSVLKGVLFCPWFVWLTLIVAIVSSGITPTVNLILKTLQ